MANAIYPLFKQRLMTDGLAASLASATIKAALIDTGTYTYSAAHETLSDLTGVVGTAVTLTTVAISGSNFDSDNPTWSSVSGNTAEAIVLYIDSGVAGTSYLIAYIDTGQTGLPVTPNGGDITYTVDAGGWFDL